MNRSEVNSHPWFLQICHWDFRLVVEVIVTSGLCSDIEVEFGLHHPAVAPEEHLALIWPLEQKGVRVRNSDFEALGPGFNPMAPSSNPAP